MSQRFEIPGRLMGRNEQEYLARSHWSKANEAKQSEQEKVGWAMAQAGIRPVDGPVEIGFNFLEGKPKKGKHRDEDNILGGASKVVFDQMKAQGIIPDDGPEHVRNIFARFAFNVPNPHIEVEIMDYDPNGRTVYYPPIQGLD